MSFPQETLAVVPGTVPLHGVVHGCLEGCHPAWGLVFCDPFAEEKKCAHRVLVEAARLFCRADIGSLRFDYRGTGDSPGEFAEATPDLWVQDIVAACAHLRECMNVKAVGLLGLRLGASLALQALQSHDCADFIVLWEPVISGKQYLAQNLRRSLIKSMMTDEQKFDAEAVASSRAQDCFDFDGYLISSQMQWQIDAIDLRENVEAFHGPSLVVNIGTREQPAEPYVTLAETLGGRVAAVRQEPFWNRIGLIDPGPVVELTEIWLAEQQASWLPDHQ